jgi:hypothetical protein
MSASPNESMVRRLFEEVWNGQKMDVASTLIHDEYSSRENITFASFRGLKVLEADMKFYREMYADLTFEVGEMLSDGSTVVTSWKATGVANFELIHDRKGEVRKKALDAEGVSVSKLADGKIVEHTLYWPRYPLFP